MGGQSSGVPPALGARDLAADPPGLLDRGLGVRLRAVAWDVGLLGGACHHRINAVSKGLGRGGWKGWTRHGCSNHVAYMRRGRATDL